MPNSLFDAVVGMGKFLSTPKQSSVRVSKEDTMEIKDQIVLVTGANRGIGRAFVEGRV